MVDVGVLQIAGQIIYERLKPFEERHTGLLTA